MNFVDKVRLDIYEGRFWCEYHPNNKPLDHIIYSSKYTLMGEAPEWILSTSYTSGIFNWKASLWRNDLQLELTKSEHKILKKSMLYAVEVVKEEYRKKMIKAKQYEK